MRPSPHQTNIGWLEVRMIRTHVQRLCGQLSAGPSGVRDQSKAAMRSPISPPPEKSERASRVDVAGIWAAILPDQNDFRQWANEGSSREVPATHEPVGVAP